MSDTMCDAQADASIDLAEVDRLIETIGGRQEHLVPLLAAIQQRFNYLPEIALRRIAQRTAIPAASVAGVSTFYAQFRHRPAGRHTVKVCIGTACHVKGAEGIVDAFRRHLGIADTEDTDRDRLFTVTRVACLGCCMLAPAVQIDDLTYGFVDPAKVGHVLRDFLASQRQAATDGDVSSAQADATGEVRLCLCSSCMAGGGLATYHALQVAIRELALPVKLKSVGCRSISYQTPLVEIVLPTGESFHYGMVTPDAVQAMLLRHFQPARIDLRVKSAITGLIDRLVLDEESNDPVIRYAIDMRVGGGTYRLCRSSATARHGPRGRNESNLFG